MLQQIIPLSCLLVARILIKVKCGFAENNVERSLHVPKYLFQETSILHIDLNLEVYAESEMD